MHRSLESFLDWFLKMPIGMLSAVQPYGPAVVLDNAKVLTVVVFRAPPFQVELVVAKPGTTPWPGEHRHPNVDSFEVALFNNFDFTKNGMVVNGPELSIPIETGPITFSPACVRLTPNDWHGAAPRYEGAVLFSVQHWLNGVAPTSVGLDWIGQPVDESHAVQQDIYQSTVPQV